MNIKRSKLQSDNINLDEFQLYIGNKVKMVRHENVEYFNISLTKEIFGIRKNEINNTEDIYSLTDFSNFHDINRPPIAINDTINNPEDGSPIVTHYKNLKLFTPMNPNYFYATHLTPLYYYISHHAKPKEIEKFIIKYNLKNLPEIIKRIERDSLPTKDWFYVSGELATEKDIVEIITTDENKFINALGAVYEGNYSYQKCLNRNLK